MKPVKSPLLLACSIVLLIAVGWILYRAGFFSMFTSGSGRTNESLLLSGVVLTGLALIVVFVAVLGIVYSVLDLADKGQALGLPEGSVRALIALSLVLIFVCLAAFLYSGVSTELIPNPPLANITKADIDDLKKDFLVVAQPAKNPDGSQVTDTNKNSLYNATYFVRHNKDGDDFAKQIFTTLATVFVSVISFYFGSSAATSRAGAVGKAMRTDGDGGNKNPPTITALDPSTIPAGSPPTVLKIHGDNLGKVTTVKLDKLDVTSITATDKLVTLTVPQNVITTKGTVKVSVAGADGESSTADLSVV